LELAGLNDEARGKRLELLLQTGNQVVPLSKFRLEIFQLSLELPVGRVFGSRVLFETVRTGLGEGYPASDGNYRAGAEDYRES